MYLATALMMHVRRQDLIVSSAVDSSSRVNDSTPQRTLPQKCLVSLQTILLFLRSGNQPSWLLLKKNPLISKFEMSDAAYLEQPTMVFIGEVAKEKHR